MVRKSKCLLLEVLDVFLSMVRRIGPFGGKNFLNRKYFLVISFLNFFTFFLVFSFQFLGKLKTKI